ncbi:nucleotide sugar dehydrogenase [Candidatus Lucifugimonas marina]|uniref:Nucleotide sugar dehydrogenase n=1 Tax=Candidatus Lucifugimonas marina TaxID=3038979 RepID=A0AAJ6CR27_9CHLR|nr:nucleotide sugar dehydrogenase [SAR202 cluster bacterium JH702]MDG0868261.1 nucleotide sugar dehydrogenase [SAR202 cluster bacterium JH639]WFG34905.1 nucleotide sugar dehydrogenase [SAR202 cluster bacterium JH545]WFG38856.1 nucleotide sugar dehydrogenase [SAR202 cluster bacterium JH1073]
MKTAVIGAAGHVGLGMALVLTEAGHDVTGIDSDSEKNARIMSGEMPYVEEEGQDHLDRAIDSGRLLMTDDLSRISDSENVVVVIGTPLDENMNPDMSPLKVLFGEMLPHIRKGQMIMLRSTVSPGTTDLIKNVLEQNDLTIGEDILLLFAPERVAQGKSIMEIKDLPQLIGAYDSRSYDRAESFFETFIRATCQRLSPMEAEIGKLVTNMTRYVTFALANEFHLIGNTFGVNMNKVIDACNADYPRLNLPGPGPNVGGPCLYKDGWFLIDRVPFNELISSSFRINEGMPMQILQQLDVWLGDSKLNKVAILGMTFKANSDDLRNSLSAKLSKQLDARGVEVIAIEPNVEGFDSINDLSGVDAVVLMTPHREFDDLRLIADTVNNPKCIFVDIWGFWNEMKYVSKNGYFLSSDLASVDSGS